MAADDAVVWQPSLFAGGEPQFDAAFTGVERRGLGNDGSVDHASVDYAWVDHAPGWLRGADELFAALLDVTPWRQRDIWMYERRVAEPRLTHRWRLDSDLVALPVLAEMASVLSSRYGVQFTQVGANLYRSGADSVAWHGDRVARELPEAVVALVSLGAVRPFKLRPKGGGPSITYLPEPGDLLVMGGSCQRTWEHSVPKVRRAGPRISIQFRHAYEG